MTLCASIFRKMFETLSLYFEEDVLNAVFGFWGRCFRRCLWFCELTVWRPLSRYLNLKKKVERAGKTCDLLCTGGSSLIWLFLNNQSFWPWDTCWPGSPRGREDCQRETGGWFHWKLKQKIARGTNVAITHLLGQLAFARELLHRNFQIYPNPPLGCHHQGK